MTNTRNSSSVDGNQATTCMLYVYTVTALLSLYQKRLRPALKYMSRQPTGYLNVNYLQLVMVQIQSTEVSCWRKGGTASCWIIRFSSSGGLLNTASRSSLVYCMQNCQWVLAFSFMLITLAIHALCIFEPPRRIIARRLADVGWRLILKLWLAGHFAHLATILRHVFKIFHELLRCGFPYISRNWSVKLKCWKWIWSCSAERQPSSERKLWLNSYPLNPIRSVCTHWYVLQSTISSNKHGRSYSFYRQFFRREEYMNEGWQFHSQVISNCGLFGLRWLQDAGTMIQLSLWVHNRSWLFAREAIDRGSKWLKNGMVPEVHLYRPFRILY